MLVALLLGVVTDYVVFYLSAVRRQLAAGDGRLTAARRATARYTPIIATAGAAAAAGTAALVVAGSPAFRAFGPGMALAILIGMVVAFQIPTLVFSLTRMRLVTARFLWRHTRYAILLIFIAAAFLTPSPDPWNQAVFATPMIALYIFSIGISWLAAPKGTEASQPASAGSAGCLLAIAMLEARRALRNAQRQWRWAA